MKRILLSVLICLFSYSITIAQTGKLFESEEILELELHFNMENFLADRSEDAPYIQAVMGWEEAGEAKMMDVKIKVRGNYRRHKTICSFPPVRLKTSKKKSVGTIFHKQGKLKLVPDCKGEEYVFREYLAYKTFNLLTDSSLQVRLIRITYKDTEKKHASIKQYGFLIEDESKMAKRLGGEILKDTTLSPDQVSKKHMSLVAVFQYMIGNPDWNIKTGKNVKFVQLDEQSSPITIPYDFDWSKAVNTPYANKSMGENFKRRKAPPVCIPKKQYQVVLDKLRAKREAIESLYKKNTPLKKAHAKETLDYFDEFFQLISQPKCIEDIFMEPCSLNR